ncbi:hypothetical protein E2C01_089391 [Portunus trituberculatus]|uniref:Uncharacterized protein n=1 Tax=Portunus trituberculatus TaxID=210409 RepID=A0A5B7JH25_PORTR|nr:hypothetical protein [Portunus trituberculatus]
MKTRHGIERVKQRGKRRSDRKNHSPTRHRIPAIPSPTLKRTFATNSQPKCGCFIRLNNQRDR